MSRRRDGVAGKEDLRDEDERDEHHRLHDRARERGDGGADAHGGDGDAEEREELEERPSRRARLRRSACATYMSSACTVVTPMRKMNLLAR